MASASRGALVREAIITVVLCLAAGVVIGAVGTVAHRSVATIGGATVPWGIVVALIGAGGVFIGLRWTLVRPWAVGAAALGAWVASGILAGTSQGGSVLVQFDALGLVWLFGLLALGLGAILLPMPRTAARIDFTSRPEPTEEP